VAEILDDVEADGKRAGEVIHRLRALYQKTGQEWSSLQVNEIIQETANLLHSEFLFKEAALQLELDATLPRVQGDSIELQQVLINLIVNALDALNCQQPGSRQLNIRTECDAPNTVRISIRDSGSGLTPEQLEHLGEPFFTTKPAGMGMGLAICHSIIEAHGGRMWAENNPDRGATFHLTLPVFSDSSS
jgi:signal transduction histidine kinase